MATLADLVARLSNDVPARDDVPSSEQYENCVTEAVADYSRRNPMRKLVEISVASGTADYDLPDDFLRLILFEMAAQYDDVIVSDEGLIPMNADHEERVTIAGLTLTIHPTPTYSQDRDLWYAAGHVLEDGEYADLLESDVAVIMLFSQARALMLQANKAAAEAWQYAIGDERVNKERLAASLREQATALEARYREEVATLGGGGSPLGMRANYSAAERARFGL
jgi:hypothetical protein